MSQSDRIKYLVCYDIKSPKRLGRIYRCLKKMAFPIQYSVFVSLWDNEELNEFLSTAGGIINAKEDDIRIYNISKDSEIINFGKSLITDNIIISGFVRIVQDEEDY